MCNSMYISVLILLFLHWSHISPQEMLTRKRPGYFSGCCSESKWGGARKRFKWDLFAEMMPAMATRCDEVPSWLKQRMGLVNAKFKGPCEEAIPEEVLKIADAILMDECARGLEMDTKSVTTLMHSLIDMYNEEADQFNKESEAKHLERLSELEANGVLSKDELEAVANRPPPQAPVIAKDEWTDKKMEHLVLRFCKSWGYARYKQDRPSKHLSREHPSMKRLASYIQSLKETKKIDSRLMFNWDQVWTCFLQNTSKAVLVKICRNMK